MKYSCHIANDSLRCTITTDRDLKAPVLCFSGMAPLTVTHGGRRTHGTGGYAEVLLPDIRAGQTHEFTLKYIDGFKPANRAWMPLGPYLRVGEELIELLVGDSGYKFLTQHNTSSNKNSCLKIVPQPLEWLPHDGTTLARGVCFDHDASGALQAVNKLANRRDLGKFKDRQGIAVVVSHESLPLDAYRLTISANEISVNASSYGGEFYAGITLLTLLRTHQGNLPHGMIYDEPRFSWRGQHLDTARHYYKPDTIHDLLDLMSLLKLNRFHWHFADDEAFRLQIDCYPELWQRTELRGEGHLLPALFSGAIEAGGSYSKAEAGALIKHAKELNIEVLPEIEVPAHALAITRIFPDTLDPADTRTELSVQGYQKNVLNPAMPKTWEVIDNIATEVGSMFPFNHLHLGCDELPDDTWMGSPGAQHLMAKEGLKTTDDLCGWTMAKLAETVTKNGQRPAAWEEAARGSNGGIGHNAILFSWTGQGAGLEAAANGYDVVMCPAQNVYLDMAHSNDIDDWGANWAAYISLADTIAWDPTPDAKTANKVIGVQGAFWGEFTTEDSQMWPMLLPRILGIAVKAWQSKEISVEELGALAGCYQSEDLNLC